MKEEHELWEKQKEHDTKTTARKFDCIIRSCAHPLTVLLLLHLSAVFEQLHQLGRKQQTFIL
jgi:hypothetical protein